MGREVRICKGGKVRYTDENGYAHEREEARELFNTTDVYTIATIRETPSGAWLTFEGVVGEFNSVMFESVE